MAFLMIERDFFDTALHMSGRDQYSTASEATG